MAKNNKFGFLQLANKSLAILTTSLTALLSNQSKAAPAVSSFENGNTSLSYEVFQKKILKRKLVLKLNMINPEKSLLAMHGSHSSHASHSSHSSHMSYSPPPGHYSHSSHNSHSSHYSSSPSYSPSVPSNNPSGSVYNSSQSIYTPSHSTTNTIHTNTDSSLTYYTVGSRNLYKGCKGTDVQEVQLLLKNLGYELTADGVFGATTKLVVMQFQRNHYLTVDGIIDSTTLTIIQSQ